MFLNPAAQTFLHEHNYVQTFWIDVENVFEMLCELEENKYYLA